MNRTNLDAWCIGVIEAGWLAALTLRPLFFNVFSSRVFEPDKISLDPHAGAGNACGLGRALGQ